MLEKNIVQFLDEQKSLCKTAPNLWMAVILFTKRVRQIEVACNNLKYFIVIVAPVSSWKMNKNSSTIVTDSHNLSMQQCINETLIVFM